MGLSKTVTKKNGCKSLPWWAIGSLIATHFLRAVHWNVWFWFALGLAIASYEWMAAFLH
jgi:hypothetical protein